jgi:acyl-CoA oxidase
MSPTPQWVKDLKPAGVQGTELLSQERAKSNVNVDALSTFLFTQEGIDRKQKILKILQQEKVFDKSQNYFAGRIDRFETALARAKRLRQLQVKHSWTDQDKLVANELISEPGPYGLHESMFLVCRNLTGKASGSC